MTVPDLGLFNSLTFSLDRTLGQLQSTQVQLGTGKRVNQPSDDPAAYARGELLSEQQSTINSDVAIASSAQTQLASMDGALSQTADALNTAIQDATQGADGTLSAAQMTSIGQAVGGLISQVIGAANFQYGGAYVFAGNQVLTPPFDSVGNYLGDAGSNSARLSDGTTLQLTYDGQAVFGDPTTGVIGALTALQTALNAGNQAAVAATLPQLQSAIAQIAQVRSGLGATINNASAEVNNGNSNAIVLTGAINDATGLDVAQAAAQVQLLNLQEQALVSLGTDMGKMPLINVLA